MAVYKVIQDVEAEDKLVGFLTLKTFIYAIIAGTIAYINFRISLVGGLGPARWFIILLLALPMLLFAILALPLGKEQPTEVWILSRVSFFLKTHVRTWNQSGQLNLVTITVPKKIERHLTKDITQTEVQSRLKALATTLDSRGWAVKNVNVNLTSHPDYLELDDPGSDRLVDASNITQAAPISDVAASDDIMDEQNNTTAQHFEELIQESDATRKEDVKTKVADATKEAKEAPQASIDTEFLDRLPPQLDKNGNTIFVSHKVVAPHSDDTDDDSDQPEEQLGDTEKGFLENIHKKDEFVHKSHPPLKNKAEPAPTEKTDKDAVTAAGQGAKLELIQTAKDYDYKISTVANLADHIDKTRVKQISENEVEIDLH